jgi:DNA-binding beta-propeller fold protein YncE
VAVIDVASNTVTNTLPTDIGSPINVEVTARRVYVTGLSGQVSVIDSVRPMRGAVLSGFTHWTHRATGEPKQRAFMESETVSGF